MLVDCGRPQKVWIGMNMANGEIDPMVSATIGRKEGYAWALTGDVRPGKRFSLYLQEYREKGTVERP
jgi:hypothetical protein